MRFEQFMPLLNTYNQNKERVENNLESLQSQGYSSEQVSNLLECAHIAHMMMTIDRHHLLNYRQNYIDKPVVERTPKEALIEGVIEQRPEIYLILYRHLKNLNTLAATIPS